MALTRAGLVAQVRQRLGENQTGFFADADIQRWLVEGVEDLAVKLEPVRAETTYDVTGVSGAAPYTGQSEITLSAATIAPREVLFKDSKGIWQHLEEVQYEELFRARPDWESEKSDPPSRWYWRLTGSAYVLGFHPKPSVTRAGAARVLASVRPTAMAADGDVTGLPDWLDKAVVVYAVYRARLKDRDDERAKLTWQEYTDLLNEAAHKINRPRMGEGPRLVHDARPYRLYWARRQWSRWERVGS
ncbi:MAG: hypothetical protein QN130_12245 [Armatimonadota bacterium]|nr:hypothetical protein [Armatimonadota bacterium]